LLRQLISQALLRTRRPVSHRRVAQAAHLLNQPRFDFVSALDRPLRVGADLQNALEAFHQFRMLSQSLDQLFFLGVER